MKLTTQAIEIILNAEGKALATTGKHGLNVVPVSSIRVVDGKIWLINYFFKKTLDNILEDPNVSLVCWRGFDGYQVKGRVEYVEEGGLFEEAKSWIALILPDRVVKGLLVLSPEQVCSVSPTQ